MMANSVSLVDSGLDCRQPQTPFPAAVLRRMSAVVTMDEFGTMSREELERFVVEEMDITDVEGLRETMNALIATLDPSNTGRISLPDFVMNAGFALGTGKVVDDSGNSPSGQMLETNIKHLIGLLCDHRNCDPSQIASVAFDLLDADKNEVLGEEEIALLFMYSGAHDADERNAAAAQLVAVLSREKSIGLSRNEFVLGLASGQLGKVLREVFDGLKQHRPVRIVQDLRLDVVMNLFAAADTHSRGMITQQQFNSILDNESGVVANLAGSMSRLIDSEVLSRRLFESLPEDAAGLLNFTQFRNTIAVLFTEDGVYTGVTGLPELEIDALDDMVLTLQISVGELERESRFESERRKAAATEHCDTLAQYEMEVSEKERDLELDNQSLKRQLHAVNDTLSQAREQLKTLSAMYGSVESSIVVQLQQERDDEHQLAEEEHGKVENLERKVELLRAAQAEVNRTLAAEAAMLRNRLAELENPRVCSLENDTLVGEIAQGGCPSTGAALGPTLGPEPEEHLNGDSHNRASSQSELAMVRPPSRPSGVRAVSETRSSTVASEVCSCQISGHRTVPGIDGTSDYTVYTMEVQSVIGAAGMVWSVDRRYREFDFLHRDLMSGNHPHGRAINLPPKRYINFHGHKSTDPEFVAQRLSELQAYVDIVLAVPAMRENPATQAFIGLSLVNGVKHTNVCRTRSVTGRP